MSKIRQELFFVIFRDILVCCVIYFVSLYILQGLSLSDFVTDGIYVFLILFLRSTYISPVWNLRLKWTIMLLPLLEAMMYGGGVMGHLVAFLSVFKFIVHYGYVMNWNPVFPIKDTFGNHLVEVVVTSFILSLFASLKIQTFLLLVVLSVQSFNFQWRLVDSVAARVGVDKTIVLPTRWTGKSIPIDIWLQAYISAQNGVNLLPGNVVDGLFSTSIPWELSRLLIRSIGSNPSRSQMKRLVEIASAQLVHSAASTKKQSILSQMLARGPLAPISSEPDTRLLANEAIFALTRLHAKLGESKFAATFDKTSDAKIACNLIANGARS